MSNRAGVPAGRPSPKGGVFAGLVRRAGLYLPRSAARHTLGEEFPLILTAVSPADAEQSVLNLDALAATPLERDPFDVIAVPGFLKPDGLAAANRDYPAIDRPSNLPVESLSDATLACGLLG